MNANPSSKVHTRGPLTLKLAVIVMLALAGRHMPTAEAQQIGSEAWLQDQCLAVFTQAGWQRLDFCRVFPQRGNQAVFDVYQSSDPRRQVQVRFDLSNPQWIVYYHFATRLQLAWQQPGPLREIPQDRAYAMGSDGQWHPVSTLLNAAAAQQAQQRQAQSQASTGNYVLGGNQFPTTIPNGGGSGGYVIGGGATQSQRDAVRAQIDQIMNASSQNSIGLILDRCNGSYNGCK